MNFFKRHTTLILLTIIFIVALFLRFYNLSSFPVGFHIDEASLGYNGYSLLQTGRDDNGQFLPLYIDMFGDQRPSGYHFLTILPIAVFGLSEFATRFPAAIMGALGTAAIFFVSLALFRNKAVSLIAAVLLAISPWSVILSRASGEAIVALFFILTGLAFYIAGNRKGNVKLVFLSSFFYSLSFLFYHTPRVFVPLLLICLLSWSFYYRRQIIRKIIISNLASLIIVSLFALVLIFLVPGGTGRFSQVNIYTHPGTQLVLDEQIKEDGVAGSGIFFTRASHNKIINFSLTFAENYFDYFSGKFLFISGGLPQWYVVPNVGLIYIVLLPFILYGIYLLATRKDPYSKIPLIWILVSPAVAAITVDDIPNINRAIVLFPMLEIIAALGVYGLIARFKNGKERLAMGAIFVILLSFNVFYFLHQYFIHTATHRAWYRNNGFKEVMQVVNDGYSDYDKIIVTKATGGIYPLVLFYMKYDPALYQAEGSSKDADYNGFGKFYFVPQDCPSVQGDNRYPKHGNILFVNKGECPDDRGEFLDIYREDGTRGFRLRSIDYDIQDL